MLENLSNKHKVSFVEMGGMVFRADSSSINIILPSPRTKTNLRLVVVRTPWFQSHIETSLLGF